MIAHLVKPPVVRASLRKEDYNTKDIIDLVQEVLYTDVDDTADLAKTYPHTRQGLHKLYRDLYNRISYVEDPSLHQWVQTPSYLWHYRRIGDCKSLTVFISSILQNMGIPHYIRYVSYDFRRWVRKRNYTHVYPVAVLNGQELPLDVVYEKQEGGQFGTEKPYALKKDIKVKPGLYKLGSVEAQQQYADQVAATVAEMERALADVPDSIVQADGGDIMTMSEGQLERNIWKDRYMAYAKHEPSLSKRLQYQDAAKAMQRGTIAGIGSLQGDAFGRQVEDILRKTARKKAPAYDPVKVRLLVPTAPEMGSIFKKVGNFFKKVGQKIGDLFKKFVNWIWKGPAKAMGPFYLFLFANKNKVKSPEIKRRIAAQEKSFRFIAKAGKFSEDKLKGVMLNSIKDKTGKDPREIFGLAGSSRIAGVPAVLAAIGKFVINAIGWVIRVIEKVVSLFKKNKTEAGRIDQSTSSDVLLLEEEARLQAAAQTPTGTATDGEGGGGGALMAALTLGGALLLRAA